MSLHHCTPEQQITLIRCRTLAQYRSMLEDYMADRCPFCTLDPQKNAIIRHNALWRMWHNPFPRAHTRLHLVMAPERHVAGEEGLFTEDFVSICDLFNWARQEFHIRGGRLVMRFGHPQGDAGSVLHLHANIIVPDGTGEVSVTLAKTPHKEQANWARAQVFDKLFLGQSFSQLSLAEQILVEGLL